MSEHDLDSTYGGSVSIELKPGMAWAIYSDDGPGGPCGQSMRITSPHTVLVIWQTEGEMREEMEKFKPRNQKHRLMFGVVDAYTAGGVFRVINNTNPEAM